MTTPSAPSKPAVTAAVDEVRRLLPFATVEVELDEQGGAYVIIESIPLGATYTQSGSWVGFHITFQYPFADVYPHFIRGDLARSDGAALGESFSATEWRGRSAVQVSRRSNRLDPAVDTASTKLSKVVEWVRSR